MCLLTVLLFARCGKPLKDKIKITIFILSTSPVLSVSIRLYTFSNLSSGMFLIYSKSCTNFFVWSFVRGFDLFVAYLSHVWVTIFIVAWKMQSDFLTVIRASSPTFNFNTPVEENFLFLGDSGFMIICSQSFGWPNWWDFAKNINYKFSILNLLVKITSSLVILYLIFCNKF